MEKVRLMRYLLVFYPDRGFGDSVYLFNLTNSKAEVIRMDNPTHDWVESNNHGWKSSDEIREQFEEDEAFILDEWEE